MTSQVAVVVKSEPLLSSMVSRCSHIKLDLSVLFGDGFRSNSLFSSMYNVDWDYDQFFKGKSWGRNDCFSEFTNIHKTL